jgi:tripartite-type tricarboxylate transporter receptor subunit TctC
MAEPPVGEKLVQLGAEPKFLTGEAFAEFSRRELDKWGRVIRAAGITAQ